jgi:hypothetical protein
MGLLEDLQRRAQAQRDEGGVAADGEGADNTQARLEHALRAIRAYLVKLTGTLNEVRLDVYAGFDIPQYKKIGPLRHGDYNVGEIAGGSFALAYQCSGERKHRFRVNGPLEVRRLRDLLTEHGMVFQCTETRNSRHEVVHALFDLEERVNVRFTFNINKTYDAIDMTERHHNGLSQETHTFPRSNIDRLFLDDLGNYLVRKPGKLLERRLEHMTDELRTALRTRLERERRQKEREEAKLGLRKSGSEPVKEKSGLFGRFKPKK